MHLIRRHIGRGRLAQRELVEHRAFGQTRNGRLVHGARAELAERVPLTVEGWIDVVPHEACGVFAIVAADSELPCPACQRGGEERIRRRRATQRAHLLERTIDEEVRWHDVELRVVPQPLGFLIEDQGKGAQAREVSFGIVLVGDLVLAVEEGRYALIGAGKLAHDVGAADIAVVERLAARNGLHLELDRVVVREIRTAQGATSKCPEALEARGVPPLHLVRVRQRCVGESGFRPGVLVLIEAEDCHELRVLLEALVHERIEEPVEARRGAARGWRSGDHRLTKCGGNGSTYQRAGGRGEKLATINHAGSLARSGWRLGATRPAKAADRRCRRHAHCVRGRQRHAGSVPFFLAACVAMRSISPGERHS